MYYIFKILKSHFVLLLLCCLSNFNCDDGMINPDKKELIIENERSWRLYDNCYFDQILNTFSNGSELFIANNYSVISIDSNHTKKSYGRFVSSTYPAPVISQNLFVSTLFDRSHLIFFPATMWSVGKYIQVSEIDNSYSLSLAKGGKIGAINNQQQFLTAVRMETDLRSVIFLLFDCKTVEIEQNRYTIEIDTMYTINISGMNFWTPISINSCEDNFFVSIETSALEPINYKIDSNGQLYELDIDSKSIGKFMMNDDIYYCATERIRQSTDSSSYIFKSYNKGKDWQLHTEILYSDQDIHSHKIFEFVNNKLIAVLWKPNRIVDIDMTTGTTRELDNKGLEALQISSITQFGNYVYIGTNQRLYFKKLEYFFDEKIVNQ